MLQRMRFTVFAVFVMFMWSPNPSPILAQETPAEPALPIAPVDNSAEPGLRLLDEAMMSKISADNLGDLDVVADLCEQAIQEGLNEDNQRFALDLLVSSLYEKASRILEPALDGNRDGTWGTRRSLAEKALTKGISKDPKHGESHLLLAELHQLPGGDAEAGRKAIAAAVELLADNPVRQAEAYLVQADYSTDADERLRLLDRAVELDPANLETWKERAFARSEQGKLEEAIGDLRHVLEAEPDDLNVIEELARVLAIQKNFDEAMKLCNKLIAASPDSPQPLVLRAGIYLMQDKMADALQDADAALKIDPNNLNLLYLRARILSSIPNFDEALKTLDLMLKLSSDLPQALELRSGIYIEQRKFSEAAADIGTLLSLDPQNLDLIRQQAALYLAADQPRRAIKEYSRLIELPDRSSVSFRGRADAYLAIGEHAKAIADYQESLKLEPNDESVLNNLAWVLATSPDDSVRDGKRAIELAQRACENTEFKAAHILSTLAAGYAEAGDFELAIEWSRKAVELSEDATREQLQAELKSYESKKPWRERTNTEEKEDPADVKADQFDLSADLQEIEAMQDASSQDTSPSPRIPADP